MPTYLSKDIPFRSFILVNEEGERIRRVAFENGVLELSDEEAKLFDEMLARRPAITLGIQKVDKTAIEEEVRKLREQDPRKAGVVRGGVTGATGPTIANLPKEEVQTQLFTGSGHEAGAKQAAEQISGAGIKLTSGGGTGNNKG